MEVSSVFVVIWVMMLKMTFYSYSSMLEFVSLGGISAQLMVKLIRGVVDEIFSLVVLVMWEI